VSDTACIRIFTEHQANARRVKILDAGLNVVP